LPRLCPLAFLRARKKLDTLRPEEEWPNDAASVSQSLVFSEDVLMATEWVAPKFVRPFEGVRCKQGGDAHFSAEIVAEPQPNAPPLWSKDGLLLDVEDRKFIQVN